MKKTILLLAMLLLGSAGLIRAQVIELFYDDFESGNLDNWTLVDADGDGNNWNAVNPVYTNVQAHSGDYAAYSFSWSSNVAYTPDNYMISPLVEGAIGILFYVQVNADYPDHYAVAVSSTGTDPGDFTIVFEETVADEGWIEKGVELPQGTKYVAFRHYDSDDCNFLFIDDVVIIGEMSIPTVLSTANWYGYASWSPGQADYEKHFISFRLQDPTNAVMATESMSDLQAGAYYKGYFWGYRNKVSVLYKAPVDNNNKTIGTFETVLEEYEGDIQCMSFNPVDGKLYYFDFIIDAKAKYLVRFCSLDPDDPMGTQMVIRTETPVADPRAFAINGDGEAYCLKEDGMLYRVNLTDGSTAPVGHTGESFGPRYQSLAFDRETNELIWAKNEFPDYGSDLSKITRFGLYKVNPQTAATEYLGVAGGVGGSWITCLFSVPLNESVAEADGDGITLWPNPAGNTLYLEGVDDETVSVYDNIGRLVLQERYNGQLNVSGLAPGVYIVTVGKREMRFVKE